MFRNTLLLAAVAGFSLACCHRLRPKHRAPPNGLNGTSVLCRSLSKVMRISFFSAIQSPISGEIAGRMYGANITRRAANFGISGDRTEHHLLWRIENGELAGINPKVIVLLIGTNNTGNEKDSGKPRNSPPETIAGVTAVVNASRARLPECKIQLLTIFPRADNGPAQQAQINEINPAIAKLADGKQVRFLDINSKLLRPDGEQDQGRHARFAASGRKGLRDLGGRHGRHFG